MDTMTILFVILFVEVKICLAVTIWAVIELLAMKKSTHRIILRSSGEEFPIGNEYPIGSSLREI